MSKENLTWLNTMTLIGFTSKRGNAWHFSEAHQGELSNHYEHAIPVRDVQRRLFDWEPVKVPVEYTVAGRRYTSRTRFVVARSDNGADLGTFKDSYQPHPYSEWLLGVTSNILADTLMIGSAGMLRGGAQAWVSIEVPENVTTPQGVTFRPNLTAVTSLDGSLATTYKRMITVVVCDNTLRAGLSEKHDQVYRVKHTRHSKVNVGQARDALGIVEDISADFSAEVEALCATRVSDRQWAQFLDAHLPFPAEAGGKSNARTIAERKREELGALWLNSPMVSPWKNTAFGVIQAVNTWAHHVQTVRGKSRAERNQEYALTGEFDTLDASTLDTLTKVLVSA
jgi:phage/plasmid-like protein (TIGR03299 family)